MVLEVNHVDGPTAGAQDIGYRPEDAFEIIDMFQGGATDDEVELLASEILAQLFCRCYQRLNPALVDSKTCIRESHGLRQTPSLGLRASGLQQLPIHPGFSCHGTL